MVWFLIILGAWGWAAAIVWMWQVVAAGIAYRRNARVPSRPAPEGAPFVSILVPARNEEANIAACIDALLAQEYPRFEVLAIDDNSKDRTGDLIAAAARSDQRVIHLQAPPTPEGWTGKNHALRHGAERARGAWLLFTDADARLHPLALSSAVVHAEERGLDLLSLLPRAITEGFAERAIQPAAMGYLGFWFPLDRVNRPGAPEAFANGQFLLLRRQAYDAIGGHAAVRGAYLEDVAFAREAKRRGLRMECALGKRLIAVRMYDSLPRLWRGWRRIYLHAFDRRGWLLLGKAFRVAALSAAPPVLLAGAVILGLSGEGGLQATGLWISAMAGLGAASALGWLFAGKSHSAVGARIPYAALHPLAAAVIAAILLDAARCAFTGTPTKWR